MAKIKIDEVIFNNQLVELEYALNAIQHLQTQNNTVDDLETLKKRCSSIGHSLYITVKNVKNTLEQHSE